MTSVMLTITQYAAQVGKTPRTIARWLGADEIPGAVQDDTGKWLIPDDAVRTIQAGGKRADRTAAIVDRRLSEMITAPSAQLAIEPAPAAHDRTISLEEAMERFQVGPHGLELLAHHGILIIDRFGRRGAKRVYVLR